MILRSDAIFLNLSSISAASVYIQFALHNATRRWLNTHYRKLRPREKYDSDVVRVQRVGWIVIHFKKRRGCIIKLLLLYTRVLYI